MRQVGGGRVQGESKEAAASMKFGSPLKHAATPLHHHSRHDSFILGFRRPI
ncbi:MAG: hypothetical protein ACE5JB_06615 [bacterium]